MTNTLKNFIFNNIENSSPAPMLRFVIFDGVREL